MWASEAVQSRTESPFLGAGAEQERNAGLELMQLADLPEYALPCLAVAGREMPCEKKDK